MKFIAKMLSGHPSGIMVNDMLNHDDYMWDVDKIRLVCSEDDTRLILNASRPIRYVPDTPLWTPVATGSYTAVAGFDLLCRMYHPDSSNTSSSQFSWKDFWRTKVPMRILVNTWKIWHNAIPTFSNLNRHHLRCEVLCPFYGSPDDSVSHTFLSCSFARAVWFCLPVSIRSSSGPLTIQRWLHGWIKRWKRNPPLYYEAWLTILVTLDVIWRLATERESLEAR